MSKTATLTTQTSDAAQRVPMANEKLPEMKFDAREWRFGWLMDTADLSSIKLDQFKLICRVLRRSCFDHVVDGRQFLIDAIAGAIKEHNSFREVIADKQFVNEAFETGRYFFRNLDAERGLLEEVAGAVAELDATAGLALVIRAEQVSGASDYDLDTCCVDVYSRIKSMRHLYAIKNPSRGRSAKATLSRQLALPLEV